MAVATAPKRPGVRFLIRAKLPGCRPGATRLEATRKQVEVEKKSFSVPVPGGALGGWLTGTGPGVLLLHGGPGLSNEYLDGLAEEIGAGYSVAAFQQRGLAPSTTAGPFAVTQAVADVVAVIEHLEKIDVRRP
jgi:pimeloyl-ACP methyl ester carboxylesterase